ncbi:hypothetical protein [Streptomyces sp. TE5632]
MTPSRRSPVSGFSPRRRSVLLGGLSGASAVTLAGVGLSGTAAARPSDAAAASPADFDFETGNFVWDLIYRYSPLESSTAPMDVTVLHRFAHLSTTA